jgi:hypothetical protein
MLEVRSWRLEAGFLNQKSFIGTINIVYRPWAIADRQCTIVNRPLTFPRNESLIRGRIVLNLREQYYSKEKQYYPQEISTILRRSVLFPGE